MTAPTKINSGNGRTVSRTNVLKADDPAVEREQLNRILKSLDARLYLAEQAIDEVEASSSSSSGESVDLSNLSVDTSQLDYQPIGGDAYYLNIAAGGVGTLELADEAVTTAKIDDEAVTTAKIDDDAVTFAKMQNIATDRLIGRDTASSGSPEEIAVGGGLEFTGSAGIQRSALTGDVTAPAGNNATTLATVNANVGSFGSATAVGQVTVNGKGLVTAATDVPIAITSAQVTDFTEAAQDAVGAMVNSTLTYTDSTPLLSINLGNANTWSAAQTFSAGVVTTTVNTTGNATLGDDRAADTHTVNGGIRVNIRHALGANFSRVWLQSDDSGRSAIDQNSGGLFMTAAEMNATSKYTPGLWFGSTDAQFTTTNPKVLAGVVGYSLETFAGDTDGGMGLEFFGLAINPGATPSPTSLGTWTTTALTAASSIVATTTVKPGSYTVATLPAGSQGMTASVTDANATTFASVVAGSGANEVPVYYGNGSWRIG